jgi:hypothetical protein
MVCQYSLFCLPPKIVVSSLILEIRDHFLMKASRSSFT